MMITMMILMRIQQGVKEIPELLIVGRPDVTIVALGSNVIDILEVNDILSSKDWHLSPLQRPNSIHICVTLQHVPVDEFLNDLKDSGQNVKNNPGPISEGLAPIHGVVRKIPDRGKTYIKGVKSNIRTRASITGPQALTTGVTTLKSNQAQNLQTRTRIFEAWSS
ncbi:putative sphinganine-1-phosphate aldolase [Helianthus anomalus]